MKYRKSIIILMLVIFIFAISSACASDVNDTAVAGGDDGQIISSDEGDDTVTLTDDSQVIEQGNDVKITADSTDSTFAALKELINESSYLTLDHDYEYEGSGFDRGIVIAHPITIDGQGHTIDAKHQARIFLVYSSNVTLKNITFANAKAPHSDYKGGGAVCWVYRAKGNVSDCIFINNSADGENFMGGALLWYASDGGTVSNCAFINNSCNSKEANGGAVCWKYSSNGIVSNCHFENNSAKGLDGNGGAICWIDSNNGTVLDCYFANNSAEGDGAAIYVQSSLIKSANFSLSGCVFVNNSAGNGGGAVYSYNSTGSKVNDCYFENNSACKRGAIYFDKNGEVTNCNFINNKATDDGWGGAVYFNGEGTVTDCNFTDNSAKMDGGAIYFSSNGNVSNCNFTNNNATRGGAIIITDNGNVTDCNFTDNWANDNGGAVSISDGEVTNCNFINNKATDDGWGGAIIMSFGTVSNCNFINNNATGDSWGGAIVMSFGTVSDCNFTNNNATRGGAIIITDNGNVTDCNFINNTAEWGGAIGIFGNSGSSIGNVKNCNFTSNKASIGGAIIFIQGNVTDCNFEDNEASEYGGAVCFITNGEVTDCNFINNQALLGMGGAIYFNQDNSSVTDSVFISNRAGNFSAVHLSSGVGNVSGCLFINNSAEFGVVGQAWDSYDQMRVNNNIFLNNEVTGDVIDFADMGDLNTDYNWFGNTADNYTAGVPSKTSNIWLFLNATANPDTILDTGSSEIVFKLYAYNTSGNVSNYSNNLLKPVNLTITKTNGEVDKGIVNLDEEIVFYPASAGTGSVTASVENIAYTIKINIKGNPQLSVDAQDVYYSNNTVISLNYNSTSTGKVNITLKGKKFDYTFEDLALNATLSLGKINPDEYNVTVTYSGDDTFSNATAKGNLTVTPIVDISITITTDKDECFVGDVVVWTLTVHNAGNGTNATDVYVDNNFPGDYFEMINATTDNGTYYRHIGNEYWWEIGFMANGTDATLKIFSHAKAARGDIPNFANAFAKEDDWNYTNNLAQKDVTVNKINSTLNVTDTVLDYGQTANITVTTEGAIGIAANIITQKGNVIEVEVVGFTVMIPVLDAGNYTLNVTTKADANHNPATKQANITVNRASTEITIASPTGEMSAGAMGHVAAELIPSEAGNLTYDSNDTGVVSVSSTGVIKANKAGNALITVSFAGNNNYVAAENKTIAITVNLRDTGISVNNSTLDLKIGDNFTIVASTDPAGLNVTFVPDNSGVYSVDENGTVTALRVGTGNILVKVGDGKVYAENSTEVTVTVSKIATKITLTNETIELKPHKSIGDLATLSPADAGNLTFTSSDEDIVLVSEDGIIYARIKGTATVTVSFAGNDKYKAAENKIITVNVTLNDASVSVENDTIDLNVDDTFIINATADPRFLTVYYASNNESVATVTDYGNVKAVGEGTAIITLTVGNGETYAVNSTNVTVTVSKIPAEITIGSASLDLVVGDETVIVANLTPADAGNVTFTSSNDTVVIVDAQGNIIADGKGQAVITVSFAGDDKYAAAENRTITVNVSLNDASVTVDSDTLELKVGETHTINATKHPDTILLDITYTSSDSSVASVDEKGIVTAVGEGSAVITVEVGDGEIYAVNSTNVTVTVSRIATEIDANPVTATYNVNMNLIITLKDANGTPLSGKDISVDLNGAKTYTTDNDGQVKVSTKGLTPDTYTAKITFNGTANYDKSSKEVKVTVKKATPKITAKAKTFMTTAKNKKYTVTLKDNKGKPIKKATVYLKVAGKTYKATTNSNGKATFNLKKLTKKGKYSAAITYKGSDCYKKVTKKVKITVKAGFKTVSRGSKLKNTVKMIQVALKSNGYYLSYNGHYLKVDGIFEIYTEMAVKDFQKDHGLKVTGKVDEKTAKKLKII